MDAALSIGIFVVLAILACSWHFGRSSSMIQKWADGNQFQIVSKEYCWFFKGPFFWTSSRGQTVYRVVVEDSQGRSRSGYVRCGGFFLGLFTDQIEISWDDTEC